MHRETFSLSRKIGMAAIALVFALAAFLLAACSEQPQSDETASSAPVVDSSAWKTLGDALATQTSPMASGYSDQYYVCMFQSGDAYYRVVAKMDAETDKKIDDLDWSKDDISKQIEQAASGLPLVSVEDLTDEVVSQAELDALVGKTGKELVDAGWEFEEYRMYGGDETAADFAKGHFCYAFTFDVPVDDDSSNDGGASVMDVPVKSAELDGAANDATDPSRVD